MSTSLHDDDNDYAKAIAVPRVFSENSRAKNEKYIPKNEKKNIRKNEKNQLSNRRYSKGKAKHTPFLDGLPS